MKSVNNTSMHEIGLKVKWHQLNWIALLTYILWQFELGMFALKPWSTLTHPNFFGNCCIKYLFHHSTILWLLSSAYVCWIEVVQIAMVWWQRPPGMMIVYFVAGKLRLCWGYFLCGLCSFLCYCQQWYTGNHVPFSLLCRDGARNEPSRSIHINWTKWHERSLSTFSIHTKTGRCSSLSIVIMF